MQRLSMDSLDDLAQSERVSNPRKVTRVSRKHEKALKRYKGADRSVTLGGVIAPPTKNAAKSAFNQNKPRLCTATTVKLTGKTVSIPSKLGL